MATRNYTAEAYEQIKKTIEQVDNTDVNPVKEFFSDLVLRIGQFLEFFSLDQYKEDMQKWYDIVLDSHNSTIAEVERIFDAVGKVDADYQKIMDGAVSSVTDFHNTLNCLRDVISGRTSLADGKAAANGFLTDGENILNASYSKIIARMKEQVYGNAIKEVIGDTIKIGMGFCKLFTTRDPVKYAAECKKFLDTFTATLYDLRAMTSFVVLPVAQAIAQGISEDILGIEWQAETELDSWLEELSQAQGFMDTNSVSDWLGGIAENMDESLAECPKSNPYYPIVKAATDGSRIVYDTSKAVDIAVDAYDILGDLKDTHDLVYGEYYTKEEYLKVIENKGEILEIIDDYNGPVYRVRGTTAEIVGKIVSNWTGFPTLGWGDSAKIAGNGWKTVNTLWSYAETLIPDPANGSTGEKDWMDVLSSKNKSVNIVKDVIDFASNLDEHAHKTPGIAQKPQCGIAGSNWFQCEIRGN